MLVIAAAQALAPAIRHRTRPLMMANSDFGTFGQFGRVDLFDEPPTVGGVVVTAPATLFPKQLEQPAELAKKATITPFPDWASIVFAPSETGDLIAAVFVGTALLLGPDFLLAPAGIVSDDGIRPGFALERVVGELIDGDAQWLRDRRERLAADAPLKVRLPIWLLFVAAGLLVERLLLVAFEDSSFVTSIGICACIGGGLLEVIREPLPTREERDLRAALDVEYMAWAADNLERGGRTSEREIVARFRKSFAKYRYADMSGTADGVSLSDSAICDAQRRWNLKFGRPGERTSTGFWKGISLQGAQER